MLFFLLKIETNQIIHIKKNYGNHCIVAQVKVKCGDCNSGHHNERERVNVTIFLPSN